jgi:hypothetical protein
MIAEGKQLWFIPKYHTALNLLEREENTKLWEGASNKSEQLV